DRGRGGGAAAAVAAAADPQGDAGGGGGGHHLLRAAAQAGRPRPGGGDPAGDDLVGAGHPAGRGRLEPRLLSAAAAGRPAWAGVAAGGGGEPRLDGRREPDAGGAGGGVGGDLPLLHLLWVRPEPDRAVAAGPGGVEQL